MRKLLMGITLSELGGSQKVVYDIISNLPENEYQITLLTSQDGELINWIRELNRQRTVKVDIIILSSLKREISFLYDFKAFVALIAIFYKDRYDIAHFHNSKIGILGRMAAWITGVPKIYYTVHGWGINVYKSGVKRRILELLERVAGRLCTKVVCVSEYDMQKGIENGWIAKGKACVIHNGISDIPRVKYDLHESLSIPSDIPIIATVARLSEPKNPMFAIKVAERIRYAGYDFRLLIIGDGPLRKDCHELIYNLQMDDTVLMLGTRYDVRKILPCIDVVALFSKWEGLPIAVIEAMFAAKPVIASNVGGLPELVSHGVNGFLLDSFDIEQASNYIIELFKNADQREILGTNGRKIAIQNFSLEKMVKKYNTLYSE